MGLKWLTTALKIRSINESYGDKMDAVIRNVRYLILARLWMRDVDASFHVSCDVYRNATNIRTHYAQLELTKVVVFYDI